MAHLLASVLKQRNSRVSPLLRAIVHETVFANVEIASASPAAPFIGAAVRNVFLEGIEPRKRFLS